MFFKGYWYMYKGKFYKNITGLYKSVNQSNLRKSYPEPDWQMKNFRESLLDQPTFFRLVWLSLFNDF